MENINFGYVTPETCPFEMLTEAQILELSKPQQVKQPPKTPPPAGKNYVLVDNEWTLVDNPVHNVVHS